MGLRILIFKYKTDAAVGQGSHMATRINLSGQAAGPVGALATSTRAKERKQYFWPMRTNSLWATSAKIIDELKSGQGVKWK